jgi:hypothetical protein
MLFENFMDQKESLNCPLCKLTLEDIDKLTEDQADYIILYTQKKNPWCTKHMEKYLWIRKGYPQLGKEFLKELVKED